MEGIELRAEVFKIVRANSEKSAKRIMKILEEHLPDNTRQEIKAALNKLFNDY